MEVSKVSFGLLPSHQWTPSWKFILNLILVSWALILVSASLAISLRLRGLPVRSHQVFGTFTKVNYFSYFKDNFVSHVLIKIFPFAFWFKIFSVDHVQVSWHLTAGTVSSQSTQKSPVCIQAHRPTIQARSQRTYQL